MLLLLNWRCVALSLCLISLGIDRAYFIGLASSTWIAIGLQLAIIVFVVSYNRALLSAERLIVLGLFLTWHLFIAKSLRRFGWTKVAV